MECTALLVVEPSKLLEDFGVVWIPFEDALVGGLSGLKLRFDQYKATMKGWEAKKHSRLSVAREHGQSGTRYLLRSEGVEDR